MQLLLRAFYHYYYSIVSVADNDNAKKDDELDRGENIRKPQLLLHQESTGQDQPINQQEPLNQQEPVLQQPLERKRGRPPNMKGSPHDRDDAITSSKSPGEGFAYFCLPNILILAV